ncbi:hypothetical protein [Hahella sp. NBU794]|uniref:hypothetical protein n=1 Tax=Hahella sp. NBU794 TaxID=3422590 RepID=UPI003D6FF978
MPLKVIEGIRSLALEEDLTRFLQRLGGPTLIRLQGRDHSRRRAFCTLLHGNEPSGARALYAYLRSGETPAVDLDVIIASIPAALAPPMFSQRMLPGQRDLNRCFRPPFDDGQGKLAEAILRFLHDSKPECLIDLHNTSGSGPAFGVAIRCDADHRALTSLWTNDLIVTDLRLGALMEISELDVPTVTIECGGAQDETSLLIAREGMQRYFGSEQVLAAAGRDYGVNRFRNPIRMELKPGRRVHYGDAADPDAALTLPLDAARFNYGSVPTGERLAILGAAGLEALTAKDHLGRERLHDHFADINGRLSPKHPLKLFMVTTNPIIATTDCLFYFIDCANT